MSRRAGPCYPRENLLCVAEPEIFGKIAVIAKGSLYMPERPASDGIGAVRLSVLDVLPFP